MTAFTTLDRGFQGQAREAHLKRPLLSISVPSRWPHHLPCQAHFSSRKYSLWVVLGNESQNPWAGRLQWWGIVWWLSEMGIIGKEWGDCWATQGWLGIGVGVILGGVCVGDSRSRAH